MWSCSVWIFPKMPVKGCRVFPLYDSTTRPINPGYWKASNIFLFPKGRNRHQPAPVSFHQTSLSGFQRADYTAKPGQTYTYTVTALIGEPGKLKKYATVDVTVTTECPTIVVNGRKKK